MSTMEIRDEVIIPRPWIYYLFGAKKENVRFFIIMDSILTWRIYKKKKKAWKVPTNEIGSIKFPHEQQFRSNQITTLIGQCETFTLVCMESKQLK